MTLEQVNNLVTILDLSNVIKDGMCVSEPILCWINGAWVDVFFTYGINYEQENYSGPISVFGINSIAREIVFIKNSTEFEFVLSADDIVKPSDWEEENSVYYNEYANSYESMRNVLQNKENNDVSKEIIKNYVDNLHKFVDSSFWDVYSALLKDINKFLE